MATTAPPAADPAAALGPDRLTPRVVFFGPPGAGKSSLIAAFLRVADPDGAAPVLLAAAGPPGLRRELVPHLIRVADPAAGPGAAVVLCDCDGRAADDLLARPGALVRGAGRGALADAVRAADALVLVVDAAASPEQVDGTFRAFAEFLGSLEEGRTFGREVGGLPVFLTLTKCDALFQPGDEPTDWLARVEARQREVRERFHDFFGDDFAADGEPSPYLAFGSVDLHLAATAVRTPPGRAFEPYSDDDGSFGVADLAAGVLPAARRYRLRLLRARQRFRLTVTGIGGLVGVMLAGLVALALAGVGGDPLADRVRAYQLREGPPAARLSDRQFARNRGELAAVRESPRFGRLPPELQAFVAARLAEFDAYKAYRGRFQPPRLGPPEVRTQAELAQLDAALAGELAPPPEYAGAWAETEAARLRAKWQADARLLREAEARLHDWYRGLVRRANQLMLSDKPPDAGWRGQVTAAAAGDDPPFKPGDKIPGSPAVPVRRGAALTYAPAFAFDRIDLARRDWLDTRDRLLGLRNLSDALGLTAAAGGPPAVLDLPEPASDGESLRLGAARLKALADAFPHRPLKHPEWRADNFPDPTRRWLEPRLRAAFDTGARHVRRLVAGRVGGDRPDDWRRLADGFLKEEPVRDWGRLLGLLRRWADPAAPDADPVQDLTAFVRRDTFDVNLKAVEVAIPDDLLADRLVPAGKLVVKLGSGGSEAEFAFRPEGDGRRERPATVFTFAPDGHPGAFPYRPGDRLTATLPLRSGGQEYRLVWDAPRSAAYQFDALAQPPALERVGPIAAPDRAPGVRVTAAPDGGLPAAPVLLPAVRAAP